MSQVFIKLRDGTGFVTEEYTEATLISKINDASSGSISVMLDIDDIGGETVSINLTQVTYVNTLPNT